MLIVQLPQDPWQFEVPLGGKHVLHQRYAGMNAQHLKWGRVESNSATHSMIGNEPIAHSDRLRA